MSDVKETTVGTESSSSSSKNGATSVSSMKSDNSSSGKLAEKLSGSREEQQHDGSGDTQQQNRDGNQQHNKQTNQQQNQQGTGPKRKHHRRKQGGAKRNKKWKPYNTLSWKEKKELEEYESRRACLKREERFAEGHPVAPYNTTQFLMEEHNKSENISPALRDAQNRSDEADARCPRRRDLEDEYYDSPNDEDSYIAKDFSETYDYIHAEHIATMQKPDLVRNYIELEMQKEKLEGKLKVYESLNIIEKSSVTDSKLNSLLDPNVRPTPVDQKLKVENEKLKKENAELRRQIEILKSQSRSPRPMEDEA